MRRERLAIDTKCNAVFFPMSSSNTNEAPDFLDGYAKCVLWCSSCRAKLLGSMNNEELRIPEDSCTPVHGLCGLAFHRSAMWLLEWSGWRIVSFHRPWIPFVLFEPRSEGVLAPSLVDPSFIVPSIVTRDLQLVLHLFPCCTCRLIATKDASFVVHRGCFPPAFHSVSLGSMAPRFRIHNRPRSTGHRYGCGVPRGCE